MTTTNQLDVTVERPKVEQRRYRRLPVSLNIEISWVDGFGSETCERAVVKDISAGGFCIEAVYERPVGSRLTVKSERHRMQCVVRHVQSRQDLYYLGLEIVPLLVVEATTGQSLDRLASALSQDSTDG